MRWLSLAATLVTLVVASVAADAEAQVVVLDFSGPRSAGARAEVVKALQDMDADLSPVADTESRARRLDVSLDDDSGRRAVAEAEKVSAFIAGEVTKDGSRFSLMVTVYSGHDGASVGEVTIDARRAQLRKRIGARIGRQLKPLLAETRAPEAPSGSSGGEVDMDFDESDVPGLRKDRPTDDQTSEDQATDDEWAEAHDDDVEEADAGERPVALEVGVLVSMLSRSYSYKDAVLAMSKHNFLFNPAPTVSLRFYPMALGGDGFLANLGLDFRFSYLLFATSKRDDIEYKTNSSDLRIGLHARIPLDEHQLGVSLAYGLQSTGFDKGDDGSDAGVPNVSLGHLRMGFDGRVMLGALSLRPALALLVPLAYGDLGSDAWFPHVSGLGIDSALHLGIGLSDSLELLIGGGYRQWGFSFNPETTDPAVLDFGRAAGGATDRYISADVGLLIRI